MKNDRYGRSLATEQGDVRNVLFHHGNSLRRTICIERVRGLLVIIRGFLVVIPGDSNLGSARLPFFSGPIKHVAGMPEIDSRSASFLRSMIGLHRFAVFPKGFRPHFRLNR